MFRNSVPPPAGSSASAEPCSKYCCGTLLWNISVEHVVEHVVEHEHVVGHEPGTAPFHSRKRANNKNVVVQNHIFIYEKSIYTYIYIYIYRY